VRRFSQKGTNFRRRDRDPAEWVSDVIAIVNHYPTVMYCACDILEALCGRLVTPHKTFPLWSVRR
jgi:hypothetical protein